MKIFKKAMFIFLCLLLTTVMAITFAGCVDEVSEPQIQASTIPDEDGKPTLGEGEKTFEFVVTDADGETFEATIRTNQTFVGDALLELKLIGGEASDYGLYVKTVNGITLDYETDEKYWAFYIGEEYALTGVDATEIVDGETYTFKAE